MKIEKFIKIGFQCDKKMKRKNIAGLIALLTIVAVVMFVGCVEKEASAPTPTPVTTHIYTPESTVTPSPTATLTPAWPTPTPFPAPAAGTGNVAGKVLWNDQPVPGAEVKLCAEVKILGGCEGLELRGTTDQEGRYFFANVPPGEYVFLARIPGEETWTYRVKFMTPIKETVREGETLIIKGLSTIKSDLKLIIPMDKAEIETTTPILEWEAYPEAAYYEVDFQYETLNIFLLSGDQGRTEEPKLDVSTTLPKPLQPGKYSWRVNAYNAHHTLIAKSKHYYHFVVTGQPPLFKLLSPADGEIVRTMPLTLRWDACPGTAYYKVYLSQDKPKSETILSFVKTWENSYTITLEPGEYHWGIDAYDANDKRIGKGEWLPDFTVEGQ
jgi:hypothetical protein